MQMLIKIVFLFFSWQHLQTRSFCSTFQIYREVAYKARSVEDMLAGCDEFMEQVTVLPPGEWDPKIRIEPPDKVANQVSALSVEMKNKISCLLGPYNHVRPCLDIV
jgi:hypothetical protein